MSDINTPVVKISVLVSGLRSTSIILESLTNYDKHPTSYLNFVSYRGVTIYAGLLYTQIWHLCFRRYPVSWWRISGWRLFLLTYWGRVTHICVSKLTIIGSDNGLSPGRRQAIIWTNAGILLIESLGTNFSENLIEILTFLFKKMHLKISSAKWRPFCLGLNVLTVLDQMTSLHMVTGIPPNQS